MTIKSFLDLNVYQESLQLAKEINKLLKNFPNDEKYLRDAIGEANEMMNHLEQSRLFDYIKNNQAKHLIERYDKVAAKLSKLKDNWRIYRKPMIENGRQN